MRFALLRVFPDPTLRRETYQTSSLPGGVVASGVEVYVFFRSDSEDSFDPLK